MKKKAESATSKKIEPSAQAKRAVSSGKALKEKAEQKKPAPPRPKSVM